MLPEVIPLQRSNPPVVARYGSRAETPLHSMMGLPALLDTMACLGVGAEDVFAGTGLSPKAISDSHALISNRQKIALFDNVRRLSPEPAVGLLAGQRQRISDLGVFGYAILSSATFGEAFDFAMRHLRLAGPILEKRFHVEGDLAYCEARDVMELGPLLPLATEFWFSSAQALITATIGRPFQARRLLLPYPAPAHAHRYAQILQCPVEFDAPAMQWHFDARALALPLPAANPIMAEVSAGFCARMLKEVEGENELIRTIKEACFNSIGGPPRADEMAARLHLSTRTLQRRLGEAGTSYQQIIDGARSRLAVEFLEQTPMSMDEIAERTGFTDVSNFRKAFRKWTGHPPSHYRGRRR